MVGGENHHQEARSASRARNQFLILMTFLLVLLAGCNKSKEDWQKAELEKSVRAYQEFIEKHPRSKWAAEAQQRIEELSYAEVEAHETPQALTQFINRFGKGPLVEKARRKLEDHDYQIAENKNTIGAFEEFAKRFPQSERSEQAKAKIEALYFEQAERMNTFASYRAFLQKYEQSMLAEKARANLALLKSAVHPLLKEVRTLGIRVKEQYSNAEDVHIPFDSEVKRVALYSDLEFIENDDTKADALVEISASGEALGESYTGGWRYAGAAFSGTMSLKVGQTTIEKRSFSARLEPPTMITEDWGGKTPSEAPFSALLDQEQSFLENFLIIMGRAFGCHVIVPYLNDADTATSERVIVAIIKVVGKSAYDIFKNLSNHEELHIRQAAMTGFGKLKDPRSLGLLEKAVETEISTVVGWKAAEALDNMGWTPPNAEARVWYLLAKQEYKGLAKMGGAALDPLVHLLENAKGPSERKEAARWLRVLKLKGAVQPLIEALGDEDFGVREVAYGALKEITGKDLGQNQENWRKWWEENKDKYLKKG